jgi:hypothetical protein
MPKFEVQLTRDTTESTTVTVDAASKDDAFAKALNLVKHHDNTVEWDVDDENTPQPPYLGDDIDNCVTEQTATTFDVTVTRNVVLYDQMVVRVEANSREDAAALAIDHPKVKSGLSWKRAEHDPFLEGPKVENEDDIVEIKTGNPQENEENG